MTSVISQRNTGLALALAVLVIRVVSGMVFYDGLREDPDAYRSLAENWARHGTFGLESAEGTVSPTAYRPPLYPWLLSWFIDHENRLPSRFVFVLHAVMGSLTCLIAADIYRRFRPGDRSWPMVGLFVAVDPILLRQASLIMTETLATFLGLVSWWLWLVCVVNHGSQRVRGGNVTLQHQVRYSLSSAVAIAIVMAANVYCRPTGVVWVFLLLVGTLFLDRSITLLVRLRWSMAVAAVILIALTPWATRNQRVFGERIWLTTHGGYTLLLANNPLLYEHLKTTWGGRNWDASPFHQRWRQRRGEEVLTRDYWITKESPQSSDEPPSLPQMKELLSDRLAQGAAMATIRDQPLGFVGASLVRIAWLWALWPADGNGSPEIRVGIGLWYGLSYVLAGLGLVVALRHRCLQNDLVSWLPGLMLVVSLTMVHAVYWSNMRMRAPCMPTVYMFAAMGMSSCITRIRNVVEVDRSSQSSIGGPIADQRESLTV